MSSFFCLSYVKPIGVFTNKLSLFLSLSHHHEGACPGGGASECVRALTASSSGSEMHLRTRTPGCDRCRKNQTESISMLAMKPGVLYFLISRCSTLKEISTIGFFCLHSQLPAGSKKDSYRWMKG